MDPRDQPGGNKERQHKYKPSFKQVHLIPFYYFALIISPTQITNARKYKVY